VPVVQAERATAFGSILWEQNGYLRSLAVIKINAIGKLKFLGLLGVIDR